MAGTKQNKKWEKKVLTVTKLETNSKGHKMNDPFLGLAVNSICVCVQSCLTLFVIPWTVAHQALLPMEFSRQEYWSGFPFPTLGDLPDPGIEFT